MASSFNTQIGGGKYCLQFETDTRALFEHVQSAARDCIDYKDVQAKGLPPQLKHAGQHKDWLCPRCGWCVGVQGTVNGRISNRHMVENCARCGQKIDWNAVEGSESNG